MLLSVCLRLSDKSEPAQKKSRHMILIDNETKIDLLDNEAIATTIFSLFRNLISLTLHRRTIMITSYSAETAQDIQK